MKLRIPYAEKEIDHRRLHNELTELDIILNTGMKITEDMEDDMTHHKEITINEGLTLLKSLKQRYSELSRLQSQNARKGVYVQEGAVIQTDEPTYDVKALDVQISRLAREIRKLDSSIKATNAVTPIVGYFEPNEDIFDGPK